MDALSGLAVFVRVVEDGSFSAAARSLFLSKSAVSKQVSGLEDRLGARLLNRTTRRLTLTDAGTVLYERAQRILAEVGEAEAEVSQLTEAPRGVLRINLPLTFGIAHIGPLLPDVTLDVVAEDRVVNVVEEGFDAAVRIAALPESSLIARRLCSSPRILAASPAYGAAHGLPQRPEDLHAHACLTYAYNLRGNEWTLEGPGGRRVSVRVRGPLRVNNGEIMRSAALAGMRVVLSPTFIIGRDVAEGRLLHLLPEWRDTSASVYVVHPHARLVPAKVRAFIDYLAEAFSGPRLPWEHCPLP